MKENMRFVDTAILLCSDIVSFSRSSALNNFHQYILPRNLKDIQSCRAYKYNLHHVCFFLGVRICVYNYHTPIPAFTVTVTCKFLLIFS
jgi:hypothetical protein